MVPNLKDISRIWVGASGRSETEGLRAKIKTLTSEKILFLYKFESDSWNSKFEGIRDKSQERVVFTGKWFTDQRGNPNGTKGTLTIISSTKLIFDQGQGHHRGKFYYSPEKS